MKIQQTFPILYSTQMVRAKRDGRKTQTRRVIKPQPEPTEAFIFNRYTWIHKHSSYALTDDECVKRTCAMNAPYQPGDILWTRETWAFDTGGDDYGAGCFTYRADGEEKPSYLRWLPSIHMPKAAARFFDCVTDVRVERLCDISNDDAIAEGIWEVRPGRWHYLDPSKIESYKGTYAATPRQAYMWLWNGINAKRGSIWAGNPWVWVYTFEPCDKPEGWPV